jgi:hypothetical protein
MLDRPSLRGRYVIASWGLAFALPWAGAGCLSAPAAATIDDGDADADGGDGARGSVHKTGQFQVHRDASNPQSQLNSAVESVVSRAGVMPGRIATVTVSGGRFSALYETDERAFVIE